jgi:hypothetical protein
MVTHLLTAATAVQLVQWAIQWGLTFLSNSLQPTMDAALRTVLKKTTIKSKDP